MATAPYRPRRQPVRRLLDAQVADGIALAREQTPFMRFEERAGLLDPRRFDWAPDGR